MAGLIGALTGLGGGVILIPALVLLFHINIYYAMGASLVSVMATSSGAATAYLREGYTNLRIGMFLETGAVIGALVGAILVPFIPKTFITLLFAIILFISAFLTLKRNVNQKSIPTSHAWATQLRLGVESGPNQYTVQNVPLALAVMTIAGSLAGLLGIGAGVLKVLAMDQMMRLPYKVSTATSNFIIGITAAVSVGIYYANGYIEPGIIFPVMLGVTLGAVIGGRVLIRTRSVILRIIFSIMIGFLGIEMFYKALTGAF